MICPQCGYAMDAFDKECPRCHGEGMPAVAPKPAKSVLYPSTAAPSQPTKPSDPAAEAFGKSCANIGCGCLGAIVLLFLVIRILSSFDPESGKLGDGAAYGMARRAIERQLKAPSTAKFPNAWDTGVAINQKGDDFYIASYVDAQNSFGAMLRQKWVAVVHRSADGKDMTLSFAQLVPESS